jgi:hypothetical protein
MGSDFWELDIIIGVKHKCLSWEAGKSKYRDTDKRRCTQIKKVKLTK